ncbi:MAG: transcriptional regulator [Desulfuromonadales bacterium GWD2_61_12]|nr:MAG: transcriptional regulator [Desulfuromonadales bacterium GWC2_61_20]OGR35211.1 MAG: transcriptional regulator [Desulfuromonadales bacterium GWD2_61_12]
MGDALFTKTQRQVLGLLFGNPHRSYYLNEIVRTAGVGIGTVQRELDKLARVELLTVSKIGNQKHYQANRHAPIFEELRGLVQKTFGVGDLLRLALTTVADRISVAFVYGSVAKGTDTAGSDIDLLVVADKLTYAEIFALCAELETKLGRKVSPNLYQSQEFRTKLATDSSFVTRIIKQPKIFLIGTVDDIPQP